MPFIGAIVLEREHQFAAPLPFCFHRHGVWEKLELKREPFFLRGEPSFAAELANKRPDVGSSSCDFIQLRLERGQLVVWTPIDEIRDSRVGSGDSRRAWLFLRQQFEKRAHGCLDLKMFFDS